MVEFGLVDGFTGIGTAVLSKVLSLDFDEFRTFIQNNQIALLVKSFCPRQTYEQDQIRQDYPFNLLTFF